MVTSEYLSNIVGTLLIGTNLSRTSVSQIIEPYLPAGKGRLPYFMKIEYNNLYTHFIFTTLHRLPLISEKFRERIEKYITGIVNNNDSHLPTGQAGLYAIYANPEHVHWLASRSPGLAEETLASIVAESSQRFISQNKLCIGPFAWQESASAFSVSKSDVDRVCKYILNQPEHHKKVSFAEEYEKFIHFYQKTLYPFERNRRK